MKQKISDDCKNELTKYVVGAKANPPKNPISEPKNGKLIPTNIVSAAEEKIVNFYKHLRVFCISVCVKLKRKKHTNIYTAGYESERKARLEIHFLHQHCLYHVKNWHGKDL